jgi:DNA-binding transcriptional regulator YiaG
MKRICTQHDVAQPWKGRLENYGVEIDARGRRCGACGEIEFTPADMEHNEREVVIALVARGVRSGTEFKFVRKMTGFKATEVASMLGVRPETVSRWERNEVDVPRAAAFALGELYERPVVTRRKLEAFVQLNWACRSGCSR